MPRREHGDADVEPAARGAFGGAPLVKLGLLFAGNGDVADHALHFGGELGPALQFQGGQHAALGVVVAAAADQAAGQLGAVVLGKHVPGGG